MSGQVSSGVAADRVGPDWSFAGPRMSCRLVDHRDRDLYRKLYTSAEVMAQIGPTMSDEQADAVFAQACSHNLRVMPALRARYWAVTERASSRLAGIGSLVRETPGGDAMEIGVMLLPDHQRGALGKEVFAGIVALARAVAWRPPLRTLFARHAEANGHAGRLPESCGFAREGRPGGEVRWYMTMPTSGSCPPPGSPGSARAGRHEQARMSGPPSTTRDGE